MLTWTVVRTAAAQAQAAHLGTGSPGASITGSGAGIPGFGGSGAGSSSPSGKVISGGRVAAVDSSDLTGIAAWGRVGSRGKARRGK